VKSPQNPVPAPPSVETAAGAVVQAPARATCHCCDRRPALLAVPMKGRTYELCGSCLHDYATLEAA
jgi:hypothetical protein